MAESINVPIEVKWMKTNLFPDGDEVGFEAPSKTRLQKKARESVAQPVAQQYVQPVAQPVAEEPQVHVPPRPAPRQRVQEPEEDEIPSIHYTSAPRSGPSLREQQLEAELAKYRAVSQQRAVSKAPPPSPEESEDEYVEEVQEKRDVPTKRTRSEREPKEESWFDKVPTWGKIAGAIGIGLLLKGGVGAPAAAAVAKPVGGNPWAL